jgi:hypothetical protein
MSDWASLLACTRTLAPPPTRKFKTTAKFIGTASLTAASIEESPRRSTYEEQDKCPGHIGSRPTAPIFPPPKRMHAFHQLSDSSRQRCTCLGEKYAQLSDVISHEFLMQTCGTNERTDIDAFARECRLLQCQYWCFGHFEEDDMRVFTLFLCG